MKYVFVFLLLLSTCEARERVKITSYSKKYYGRRTCTGDTLRRNDLSCAVNRNRLKKKYIYVRLWVERKNEAGYRIGCFYANDVFCKAKFACSYLKLDLTQGGYRSLGIEHTTFGEFIFAETKITKEFFTNMK